MSVPLKFVRRLGAVCEAGQHGACVAADSEIGGRHWVCTCDCHEDPAMESWSLIEQALLEAGQPDGLGIVEAVVSLREALCERAERAEATAAGFDVVDGDEGDDGGSLWSIACEKGDDDEPAPRCKRMEAYSRGNVGAVGLVDCDCPSCREPQRQPVERLVQGRHAAEVAMNDRAEGLVAGDVLPTSLADFIQAAAVQLEEEQRTASPDNARIGFLCNAVRLAREHARRFPDLLGGVR